MQALQPEQHKSDKRAKAAAEIGFALRAAHKRLRATLILSLAAWTLPIAVAAAALWLAIGRFTLLDLPWWPVVLLILLWALALLVTGFRPRISDGRAARYLDHTLLLDERMGTLVELVKAAPVQGLSAAPLPVPAGLLEDTAFHVRARISSLPAAWSYRPRKWQVVSLALAFLALVAAQTLPSPLDEVRAERAALQRTVAVELNKIAELKAEIVTRPELTDADRQAIADQLDGLTQSLSDPNLDRSALLAALSDAQQKIQQLSTQTSADFDNMLAAARNMQQATVNASRGGTLGSEVAWNPDDYPELSDLGKAAAAADALGPRVRSLSTNQARIVVPFLQQASTQAAPDDSELGKALLDASQAVGAKDIEKATPALQQVSLRFQEADHRWQLTQSVEKIMSNLDESRQSLAQAGTQPGQKKQVGFRRPGTQTSNAAQTGPSGTRAGDSQDGTQGSQNDQNSSQTAPSAFGAPMGSNSPDYRSLNNTSSSSAGSTNGSQASTQAGSGSPSQPGAPGSAGSGQPGAGSSGAGDGTQGTFSGQIAGPVGGGAGAISQVPNPQGQGLAEGGQGQQPSAPQSDSLYIPPSEAPAGSDASGGSVPGQAAPEQPGDGVQGRGSGGGDGPQTPGEQGAGTHNQIRTPYKEVIGQYAQEAAQALEHQYVPTEAKEYVKDYFAQLGK